jgi:hypothetical protein
MYSLSTVNLSTYELYMYLPTSVVGPSSRYTSSISTAWTVPLSSVGILTSIHYRQTSLYLSIHRCLSIHYCTSIYLLYIYIYYCISISTIWTVPLSPIDILDIYRLQTDSFYLSIYRCLSIHLRTVQLYT